MFQRKQATEFAQPSSQRGVSLVELIMFIVIVSVALAGILLVFNVTTKGSADPLVHKQALAAAESLLEEIQLQDFSPPSGVSSAGTMNDVFADRAAVYHTVLDYHQFPLGDGMGIYPLNGGTPITGLENYRIKATVEPLAADWNGVLAASAVLITVTVTVPQGTPIEISGYRTDYCCSKVE
ncbi:MAG: hypothetical protein A2Z65_02065 [Gallionellales bacterium RIFCSPLOWO2_02_58_13]|nr:MAG: hypothetical protein A2Z65_02065 [Gallionellales bacterium RIFCSPLOWO2_02_58_13]